jgi:hypothetical protein
MDIPPLAADVLPVAEGQPQKIVNLEVTFCNCATALLRNEYPCFDILCIFA